MNVVESHVCTMVVAHTLSTMTFENGFGQRSDTEINYCSPNKNEYTCKTRQIIVLKVDEMKPRKLIFQSNNERSIVCELFK